MNPITHRVEERDPEFAFYYPGQYWMDADWAKNLILFFDGIAMLIPSYMEDYLTPDDNAIISALKDFDLFRVIRPEEKVGKNETRVLGEALCDVIASGRLDHLTRGQADIEKHSVFGSLSMSRMGYHGDEEIADFVFQELKDRGLARDTEDGVSIPMHRTVRALILVLLAQILRSKGTDLGMTLSPITDQDRLVDALNEIISDPESSTPSPADIISFDMAMVGVDLGVFPIDEILDFRRQHLSQHRKYCLSVRRFVQELSRMTPDERQLEFEERQEELDEAAQTLRKLHRSSWRRPISIGLSLAGAAWNLVSGDPIGAAIEGAGAVFGSPSKAANEVGVYSYLFTAKNRFY